MALPSPDVIRGYYLSGKWTDAMLQTALVCKSLTQVQYDALLAEKKKTATSKTK